jgi:hypothetical protein
MDDFGEFQDYLDNLTHYPETHKRPNPRRRFYASKRCGKFLTYLQQYESHKHDTQLNGPMKWSDRYITGMFDIRNQGIYGDKVLNDLFRVFDEYHDGTKKFMLRPDQKPIVSYVLVAFLPFIYGVHLEANKERVLRLLGATEIREAVLVLAGRRAGKSFGAAYVIAGVMIVVPFVEMVAISVAKRQSKRIMESTKFFLNLHPRGQALLKSDPEKGRVVINTEELRLVGDQPNWIKTLFAFPASTDVCIPTVFILGGDKEKACTKNTVCLLYFSLTNHGSTRQKASANRTGTRQTATATNQLPDRWTSQSTARPPDWPIIGIHDIRA